jgi:hypothetical protein
MDKRFDTIMKVSKCIFDVEHGLKIANRTCWNFKCHRYSKNCAWGEKEYSNLWYQIQRAGEVYYWNVLLYLLLEKIVV